MYAYVCMYMSVCMCMGVYVYLYDIDSDIAIYLHTLQLTLDQKHNFTWQLQFVHHILQRSSADHFCALGLILQKLVDLLDGAIVRAHHEAIIIHVQDEILTHNGQTDQGNICFSMLFLLLLLQLIAFKIGDYCTFGPLHTVY